MAQVLLRRGAIADLPVSATEGEPLFTTDTKELYIGTGTGVAKVTDVIYNATAPTDTSKLWIDTTADLVKRYNGSAWVPLANTAAATFTSITGSPTDNTALATALGNKADAATTYTKTEVNTKISDLVASAPAVLDTLNEIATALGNDPNFATTLAGTIGSKATPADITTAVDAEITLRLAGDKTNSDALLAEITARDSGDTTNSNAILVEITAREAGDQGLSNLINAEITARMAESAGFLTQANLDAEVTLRDAGDAANSAAVLTEVTARTAGDKTNSDAILAEITARAAGDKTNADALLAEITARMAADITYTASLGITKSGNDFQLASGVAGTGLTLTTGVLSVTSVDGGAF